MKNITLEYYKKYIVLFTLAISFVVLIYTLDYTNSIAKGIVNFFDNVSLSSFSDKSYKQSYKSSTSKVQLDKKKNLTNEKNSNKFFDKEYEIKVKGIDY